MAVPIVCEQLKNGGFNFSDPNVGFVAMLAPKGLKHEGFPDVSQLSLDQLSSEMRTVTRCIRCMYNASLFAERPVANASKS